MELSKTSRFLLRCGIGLALSGAIYGAVYHVLLPMSIKACACASEEVAAKTYVGALLRSQQAHYFEYAAFAPSLDVLNQQLGLGIPLEDEHYRYFIRLEAELPVIFAMSKTLNTTSYVGKVIVLNDSVTQTTTGEERKNTATILCADETTQSELVPPFINEAGQLECSSGLAVR